MNYHFSGLIDHLEHVSRSSGVEFGEDGELAKMKTRVLQVCETLRDDDGEDAVAQINKNPTVLGR